MKTNRLSEIMQHLLEEQLDDAQKADETRLFWRLCLIKDVVLDDTDAMAARRVGASQLTSGWWLKV